MVGRITSITHAVDVPDLARGMRWYTGLLGRGPDLEPVEGVLEWQLQETVWLQVAENPVVAAGGQMLRIGVADIGGAVGRLSQVGIDTGEVERIEGVIAFCEFDDPFGNHLSLYQVL